MTSCVTCSGSAVESTIMALRPPVSAISGTMGRRSSSASVRWMFFAVAVEPVKAMPATRRSATSAWPGSPPPGAMCRTARGMPASCASRTAAAAMRGVCGAGLATTAFPAASAAATWPVKIASGKFHGAMQPKTPRPSMRSVLVSPVGPGRGISAKSLRARRA